MGRVCAIRLCSRMDVGPLPFIETAKFPGISALMVWPHINIGVARRDVDASPDQFSPDPLAQW